MGIHLKSTKEFFIIESDEEEEFIDMEILTSPCCFYNNKKEFEFQLMPTLNEQHSKASADELFYKGKLLPLPLQTNNNNNNINTSIKLCQHPQEEDEHFVDFEQVFLQPFTSTNTPNISPSESCRVSCELFEHDNSQFNNIVGDQAVAVRSKKSSWSTKLKHSSLGKKLIKVSRSYLKSFLLFPHNKSASSNTKNENENENGIGFRKSFSGVVQRHNCCSSSSSITSFGGTNSNSSSGSSSSSSSSSSSFSCYYDLHCLNRFSSSSFELETPIDGAIAHCKQSCSQHFFTASTSTNILLLS